MVRLRRAMREVIAPTRSRSRRREPQTLESVAWYSESPSSWLVVVVFHTLDVDVIVVVLDAVFFIEFLVDFFTKSGQYPTFENDTVEERNKQSVKYDLPDEFREDVRRVERDGPQFVPEGHSCVVRLGGELIDNHSHNVSLLRIVVNS
jgi:hypothetical protein